MYTILYLFSEDRDTLFYEPSLIIKSGNRTCFYSVRSDFHTGTSGIGWTGKEPVSHDTRSFTELGPDF